MVKEPEAVGEWTSTCASLGGPDATYQSCRCKSPSAGRCEHDISLHSSSCVRLSALLRHERREGLNKLAGNRSEGLSGKVEKICFSCRFAFYIPRIYDPLLRVLLILCMVARTCTQEARRHLLPSIPAMMMRINNSEGKVMMILDPIVAYIRSVVVVKLERVLTRRIWHDVEFLLSRRGSSGLISTRIVLKFWP